MGIKILLVFLGGGLGSILRFGLSEWMPVASATQFPWATFWANLMASLILGLLLGVSIKSGLNRNLELLLMVGLCGGFSTFSTFSKEVFVMIESGQVAQSLIYILSSVLVCVLAIYIGSSFKLN